MNRFVGIWCFIFLWLLSTVFGQELQRVPPSVKPCLKPIQVKADLSNIENLREFEFTDEQKAFVAKNHMLIYDGGLANPVSAYLATPVPFVTSDIVLHAYHVLVSNTIEESERVILRPSLQTVLHKAFEAAKAVFENSHGKLKAGARKNVVLFGAAIALLGGNPAIPAEVQDEVNQTVDAITKCRYLKFDSRELDPTLFKPRAGYEEGRSKAQKGGSRWENRERYFRTTTWLAQAGLQLSDIESLYCHASDGIGKAGPVS